MKAIELIDKSRAKPVFKVHNVERLAYHGREYAKLIVNLLKKKKAI